MSKFPYVSDLASQTSKNKPVRDTAWNKISELVSKSGIKTDEGFACK